MITQLDLANAKLVVEQKIRKAKMTFITRFMEVNKYAPRR